MLKFLKNKYPQHAKKIDYLDLVIDIAFWSLVLYVWFFGILEWCDPYKVCKPCLDMLNNTFGLPNVSAIPMTSPFG